MSVPYDHLLVEVLSPPETEAFIIGRSVVGDTLTGTGVTLVWDQYLGYTNAMTMNRGGAQNGAATSLDVGTLSIRLVNAGDPLTNIAIQPNSAVRVTAAHPEDVPAIVAGGSASIFTGTIQDVLMDYSKEGDTFVTILAADGVQSVNNTMRYGAISEGGMGYETWANRISSLCSSAQTPVNPPVTNGLYAFTIGTSLVGEHLTSEGAPLRDVVYESTLSNHFDMACNSVGAYWWADRDNVVQFAPALTNNDIKAVFYDVTQEVADPMHVYFTSIRASYDTKNVVNNLELVNHGMIWDAVRLAYVANDDTFIEQNTTSMATWGSRGSNMDTCLYTGGTYTAAVDNRALKILTDYATPAVSIQSVTYNALENINFAWTIDLYSRVQVNFKGVTHNCRVTGINHDLRSKAWSTTLTLRKET